MLAGLLLTAGVGKLLDREGGHGALRGFGVAERLVGPVALLLPVSELVIAVGLIPPATARWSALAAAASMAVFSIVIARALVRGERVECHCFGALSDSPAGPGALVRNLVIAVAALLVAFAPGAPGPAVTTWLGDLSPAQLVAFWLGLALVAVCMAAAWFGRELLRAQGRLMLRVEQLEGAGPSRGGLPAGAPAPGFRLASADGHQLSLGGLLAARRPVLLTFTDPGCGPCYEAIALVGQAQQHLRGAVTTAVISVGNTPASAAAWAEHGIEHVGIAEHHDVHLSYGVRGTPSAVLISAEGRIDSPLASGLDRVAELLAQPTGQPSREPLPRPEIAMPLAITHTPGGQ